VKNLVFISNWTKDCSQSVIAFIITNNDYTDCVLINQDKSFQRHRGQDPHFNKICIRLYYYYINILK